jgi:hypothetical protein
MRPKNGGAFDMLVHCFDRDFFDGGDVHDNLTFMQNWRYSFNNLLDRVYRHTEVDLVSVSDSFLEVRS